MNTRLLPTSFPGVAPGSEEEALLRTIMAEPEADAPRLVYADWLEEQGDSDRAEFIRLSCSITAIPESSPEWQQLRGRMYELKEINGALWTQFVPAWGRNRIFFHRGLLTEIRCPLYDFTHDCEQYVHEWPTLHVLTTHGEASKQDLEHLLWCEPLLQFTSILLSYGPFPFTEDDARLLARNVHLRNLSSLEIYATSFTDAVQPSLFDTRNLSQVKSLKLTWKPYPPRYGPRPSNSS
jgi:uncharacterized protein (TIGR02996 family)